MPNSEFINELLDLLKRNNAEIYYTNDDDGVHIAVNGDDVFVGLMQGGGEFINEMDVNGVSYYEFEKAALNNIAAAFEVPVRMLTKNA